LKTRKTIIITITTEALWVPREESKVIHESRVSMPPQFHMICNPRFEAVPGKLEKLSSLPLQQKLCGFQEKKAKSFMNQGSLDEDP
jgi:hypothetical protein